MAEEIVGGLRGIVTELKAVQNQMAGLDAGSDEFVKLSLRAGELRDRMKDVKEAVSSQAGPAIANIGNNASIAQGQLMELDLEGFGESLKRVGANVKQIDLKTFKEGLISVGDGIASIGKALLSNPLFYIAAAIAGAVAAFEYFTNKQKEAAQKLAEQRQRDFDAYKKQNELSVVQAQGAADKIYAIRMEELKREQAFHWAVLMAAKQSHDQGIALSDSMREKEKVAQVKFNELRIEMEKMTQERLNQLTVKRVELDKQYELVGLSDKQKSYKQLEQTYSDQIKSLKEIGGTEEDLAKQTAIYNDQKRKLDTQYHKEALEKSKERKEKSKADHEFELSLRNEMLQITLKKEQYELLILEQNYQKKKEEAKKHGVDLKLIDEWYASQKLKLQKETDEKAKELEKKNNDLLRDIKNQALDQQEALSQEIQDIKQGELATDIQNVRDAYNEKIEYAKKYNLEFEYLEKERDKKIKTLEKEDKEKKEKDAKELIDKEKERKKKAIEDELELVNAKYDISKQYITAAQSLTDAMTSSGLISAKKSFQIGKALSIAQTTISTIQGVQNALNAYTTVPDPFGTALKIANAVAIGASGAASIAKISATQFQASGGGGGNIPTPNINSGGGMDGSMGGQAPAALNLSALQGNTSVAPLQTYVVAGQVSSAQQAEFKIKNTASILGGG